MKKIMLLSLSLLLAVSVFAQKVVPKIKEGSAMNFNVDYHGQPIDFTLTVKSLEDPIKMDWDVQGAGGSYEMPKKALEEGNTFNTSQPAMNGVTRMKDTETFCFISKAAFQSLLKNKSFTYSANNYTLKDNNAYKAGSTEIDAMHVVSTDGKTEMWIMNDPNFPVVLQIQGNPTGVNFVATSIKE